MAHYRYLKLFTLIMLMISSRVSTQVLNGKIKGFCTVKCQPVEQRNRLRMFTECFTDVLRAFTEGGLTVEANFPSNCGKGYVPCLTSCAPYKVSRAVTQHVVYSPWQPSDTDCHFDPRNLHIDVIPGDCYYNALIKDGASGGGGYYISTNDIGFIQIPVEYVVNLNEFSATLQVYLFDFGSPNTRDILYIKTVSANNEVLKIQLEETDHILSLKMHTVRKHFQVKTNNIAYGTWVYVGVVCIVDVGVKLYYNGVLVGTSYVSDGQGVTNNYPDTFMLGMKPSTVRSDAHGSPIAYEAFYVWLRQVSHDEFSDLLK